VKDICSVSETKYKDTIDLLHPWIASYCKDFKNLHQMSKYVEKNYIVCGL
jgi:hypothetical protein